MQRSRRIKYNTVKKAKGSAREGGTGQQTNEARGAETMSQETDSQGQTLSAFEPRAEGSGRLHRRPEPPGGCPILGWKNLGDTVTWGSEGLRKARIKSFGIWGESWNPQTQLCPVKGESLKGTLVPLN